MDSHARNTVAIIGAGSVGASVAFSLVTQGVCDRIFLIDVNRDKAYGEALDLNHSIDFLNRNVKISAEDFSACTEADIVVLTASAPMPKEAKDRLSFLETSKEIVKSCVDNVMEQGFCGRFIVITNPVDVMSYYVWRVSGLPACQVIGSGTSLDTARLKWLIANQIGVDPRSVHAVVMGEHGDSGFAPESSIILGGKLLSRIRHDNKGRFPELDLDALMRQVLRSGWEIFSRKGNTSYGIASAAVGILKAILYDENRIIPVSTLLAGEYGEKGLFIGVPAIINRDGVKEIVEIPLTDAERNAWSASCAVIRAHCESLF